MAVVHEGPAGVTTAVSFSNHRMAPLTSISPFVHALESSGVVDQFWVFDELTGWFPDGLFLEGVDPHSTHDPIVEASFALAASQRIGVRMTTDAVRTRPAELVRALLSLASATEGRVTVAIGAGEARHMTPYGYKTGEGLRRLEDVLQLADRLRHAEQPFDFDGNFWHFDNSYVGRMHERTPEFWTLGGGPKLVEIAAKYADGLESAVPNAMVDIDQFRRHVRHVREQVERHGRDPDAFGFGVWLATVMHEDRAVLDKAMDTPEFAWYAAAFGRMNQKDWEREGLDSVMPPKWHYSNNYMPFTMTRADAMAVVETVPREMVEKALLWGAPDEIGSKAQEFVDAGASFVGVADMLPLVAPQEAPRSLERSIHLCGLIKQHVASAASV